VKNPVPINNPSQIAGDELFAGNADHNSNLVERESSGGKSQWTSMTQLVTRKRLFRVIVSLVIAAVISFAVPVFVSRPALTRAVSEYVKNPNAITEATLREEKNKVSSEILVTHLTVMAVLGCIILVCWSARDFEG